MGKGSGIAWTTHTFNPWWGCVKVSPACDNCYAATFDHRLGGDHWGPDVPRRHFPDKHWNEPLRWNTEAEKLRATGERMQTLVFCASMADVFENYTPNGDIITTTNGDKLDGLQPFRERLWDLIRRTQALTWLLLTKRPQNIGRMTPADIRAAPNVWFGTTIETPAYLWRAAALIEHAPEAPVRFVSMEPLIESTSIITMLQPHARNISGQPRGINWVITGCESGTGARHTPTTWYRQLRNECAQESVHGDGYIAAVDRIPFFLKQAPRGADGISKGDGSWIKLKDGIIEQPYLDGRQYIEKPFEGAFS